MQASIFPSLKCDRKKSPVGEGFSSVNTKYVQWFSSQTRVEGDTTGVPRVISRPQPESTGQEGGPRISPGHIPPCSGAHGGEGTAFTRLLQRGVLQKPSKMPVVAQLQSKNLQRRGVCFTPWTRGGGAPRPRTHRDPGPEALMTANERRNPRPVAVRARFYFGTRGSGRGGCGGLTRRAPPHVSPGSRGSVVVVLKEQNNPQSTSHSA